MEEESALSQLRANSKVIYDVASTYTPLHPVSLWTSNDAMPRKSNSKQQKTMFNIGLCGSLDIPQCHFIQSSCEKYQAQYRYWVTAQPQGALSRDQQSYSTSTLYIQKNVNNPSN